MVFPAPNPAFQGSSWKGEARASLACRRFRTGCGGKKQRASSSRSSPGFVLVRRPFPALVGFGCSQEQKPLCCCFYPAQEPFPACAVSVFPKFPRRWQLPGVQHVAVFCAGTTPGGLLLLWGHVPRVPERGGSWCLLPSGAKRRGSAAPRISRLSRGYLGGRGLPPASGPPRSGNTRERRVDVKGICFAQHFILPLSL